MKAVRFVIPKVSGNSFRVQIEDQQTFYDTIHYHPEHQLTLFVSGEGTCFIGNKVERFKAGDVFLVGKNVPHVFKSDHIYYNAEKNLKSGCITIFFKDETFGKEFFEIPEMAHIKRLLEAAMKGVKLNGTDKQQVSELIRLLKGTSGFERFRHLLDLLNLMATSNNLQILSSVQYSTPSSTTERERIDDVFRHISTHFQQEISLAEIAEIANMTVNSFCRYFKQRTRKTFTDFLNEFRIEYASKLVAGSTENFVSIAIDSGYNNTSYFNRKFKQITGMAPMAYRKKYGTI